MEEDWLAHPVPIDPSLEENQCSLETLAGLLDPRILAVLSAGDIQSLFPVQKAVIEQLRGGEFGQSRDLLVSASTGSGKTLAYVLPVVNALSGRLVCRLRALVVVPGRELAQQVASVFEPFAQALGLSMAVVVGQTSLIAEQKKLVGSTVLPLAGGSSNVDILIATPGRLVDHLQSTPNFSLQHLQWLVIDEADRLLDQSFQDWLPRVLESCNAPAVGAGLPAAHDAVSLREGSAPIEAPFGMACWATPLCKMLFSATLTRNPAKLAMLRLNNPVYLSVSADSTKYTVPDDLEEHMIVAEDGEKALVLLHLLKEHQLSSALCFTKSVEATEKLALLLRRCCPDAQDRISSFSSDLLPEKRASLLESFNEGSVDLLICSDGAARGLDLRMVSCVINYDIPIHAKTYIHRVGRTARAGRSGVAYSLLEAREAHHFKAMLQQGRSGKQPVHKMKIKDLSAVRPQYTAGLASLQ